MLAAQRVIMSSKAGDVHLISVSKSKATAGADRFCQALALQRSVASSLANKQLATPMEQLHGPGHATRHSHSQEHLIDCQADSLT
jgi:hypothetical protein